MPLIRAPARTKLLHECHKAEPRARHDRYLQYAPSRFGAQQVVTDNMRHGRHPREREETECRECGTPFNLSAQWYYDNLCPECKAEQDGEETTWPVCVQCGEKYPPDEGRLTRIANPSLPGGSERVIVCGDCA